MTRSIASPARVENPCHDRPGESRTRLVSLALLIAILVFGTLIRVRQYAARQSFWNDEAFIVLNVLHRTCGQLLGRLEYDQAAPPVFLWIERAMAVHFGANEYALRALALSCGIIGLGLFALLSRRILPAGPALCGVALMAFCDKLGQYCVEVKQYSGDAMITVLLLLLAVWGRETVAASRRLLRAAIVAALALWFSHTTSILFGGISLVLLYRVVREERAKGILIWIGGNALFAASLAALYFVSIRHQHTTFLYAFWAEDFPNLHEPLRVPQWMLHHVYQLFDFPYPFAGAVVIALGAAGTVWLIRNGKGDVAGFCLMPIALTMVASFLRQYPFNGTRLTLFLIPCMLLLAAAGAALVQDLTLRFGGYLWLLAPAPLLVMGIGEQAYRLGSPRYRSHIRPAVEYVRAHRHSGDAVYNAGAGELPARNGSEARHIEILCYWPDPAPPFFMQWEPADSIPYRRFWLVFPFRPGKGDRLTHALLEDARSIAELRDQFVDKHGGAAYLFEKHAPGRRAFEDGR